jgi:hypothetical protein
MARTKQIQPPAPTDAAEAMQSGAVAGRSVTLGTKVNEGAYIPPDIAPCPPFLYGARPDLIAVVDGEVVHDLREFPVQVGVRGVLRSANGSLDTTDMNARLKRRGWTMIDVEHGPNGSYIAAYDVQGGVAHVPVWAQLYPGSRQTTADKGAYKAWVAGLVGKGVIKPIARHAVERAAWRLRDQIRDARPNVRPHVVDSWKSDLVAYEAWLSAHPLTAASPMSSPGAPGFTDENNYDD